MQERIENSLTLEDVLNNKKYTVNYYQREYRWGRKQIEQLIDDLTNSFEDSNSKVKAVELTDVEQFDYYYMGTIIVTGSQDVKSIIDGQQRLTSMTLLLIALNNLHQRYESSIGFQDVSSLIYSTRMNKKSFNISVPDWNACLETLYRGDQFNASTSVESVQNICRRYDDLYEILDDYFEGNGDKIALFACWLVYKIIFIRITTPSEQDAHKVFVSMNDRGLSLNTSEMLKGYLLSEIKDDAERNKANEVWKETVLKLKQSVEVEDGVLNTEDVTFIATWIRAKYAQKIREGKKDAKDQDYEIVGREFHEWVRQNHNRLGLIKSADFYNFITVEFKFYAEIYLRLKEYASSYTKGYEEVFYNADKELNYQYMFILSALSSSDSEEVIRKKIKVVATYIDCYSARRMFNFSKINWNTNKNDLFSTIKAIRNMSLDKLTVYLTYRLQDMDLQLSGIIYSDNGNGFSWNQFTGKYILHVLARFTDYVDVSMGNESLFASYVNRTVKNTYDREHVLPDKYEDYATHFSSREEFNIFRWKLGNLILLKLDKNRSYQDMTYSEKKKLYLSNNILAQSFNELCYQNNPKFLSFISQNRYAFKSYDVFDKNGITERQKLYQAMAYAIWDEWKLHNISAEWDADYEKEIKSAKLDSSTVVDLMEGRVGNLTKKNPIAFEMNGVQVDCKYYSQMVLKVVAMLDKIDHARLVSLAKDGYKGRIAYSEVGEVVGNPSSKWQETDVTNIYVDVHGSGEDHGQFVRSLLTEFGVSSFKVYLK